MKVEKIITDYFNNARRYSNTLENQKEEIIKIANIIKKSNTIFICGNGGSSAMASHMANDFQKVCGLRAICLTDNIPLITAWSNDDSYDNIFERQLETLSLINGNKLNDTIILITGSGNSENLIKAAKWSLKYNRYVIAFIGLNGGKLFKMGGINKIHIQSDMYHTENWHCMLDHLLVILIGNENDNR